MKTVKRNANVGERILITNKEFYEDRFENGAIFEVSNTLFDKGMVYVGPKKMLVIPEEYEVIIDDSRE